MRFQPFFGGAVGLLPGILAFADFCRVRPGVYEDLHRFYDFYDGSMVLL